MKKVSARLFFTVLWRGVCQALGWFFGLFGYKRDGKFARCVWGLFATSAAVIMGLLALTYVYILCVEAYKAYNWRYGMCDDKYCYADRYVHGDIYYHSHDDGRGYVYNKRTGEKYLKRVEWIAMPEGKDSLVCFSNGKKRGYFSKNTGKVVIEPKYDHAWVFADGLASVDEGGFIKFVDGTGKTVIDRKTPYVMNMEGHVFHGGYCVVQTDDGELYGMIDKTGKVVLPLEYSLISLTDDQEMWLIAKGKENGLLDKDLKPIIPLAECGIWICDDMVDVALPDHTLRKYSLDGSLIHDFYISRVRCLEYEKEEMLSRTEKVTDDDGNVIGTNIEEYHPTANAKLRAYVAGGGYEGLMTADGHVVTMPLYQNIDAIGYDLYLCDVSNGDKVIVNGKGEIVR